jgi:hypothetical protein
VGVSAGVGVGAGVGVAGRRPVVGRRGMPGPVRLAPGGGGHRWLQDTIGTRHAVVTFFGYDPRSSSQQRFRAT